MITRLQRWVWVGAWALAVVAGMINVAGILGFQHQPVTHLTGTTSMLAAASANLDLAAAAHFGAIIGCFFFGCVLSGYLVKESALKLGRRYGIALLLESLCLLIAVPLLSRHLSAGTYLLAAACGLQNAMASTYSGSVIRTTHVSGMFTDLGILAGHFLRGIPVDRRRVSLCSLIIFGFFLGGIVGALGFARWQSQVLLIPASGTALAAISYWGFVTAARRRIRDAPSLPRASQAETR
jgi:uncharacterized membrane protein YoaK (UPF0700 family)